MLSKTASSIELMSKRPIVTLLVAASLSFYSGKLQAEPTASYQLLMQDILINADLWDTVPRIMASDYAFEGIIGVTITEADVRAAGGTWNTVTGSTNPPDRAYTSASSPSNVALGFGYPVNFADALPVVFSWPVLPSTVKPENFRLTLNTGAFVQPEVVSISPNLEYNERNTVVLFGEFGNRLAPGDPDAIYVTHVEVVEGTTPMRLFGPSGPVSATGLSKESVSAYSSPTAGPYLVGAKLSVMSVLGEGAPALFSGNLPNDGVALYGDAAEYRLRLLTSGGFSADGVVSMLPNKFSRYFRLRLVDGDGVEHWLVETDVDYLIGGYTLRILGLADLGPVATDEMPYNDAYIEDHDNQIDIILQGDEQAMRWITGVHIPAEGLYSPFYNPGGPGNNPTPGVTYSSPGPAQLFPVWNALDDPMTVTYVVPEPSVILLLILGGATLLLVRRRRSAN
jgi:hypothetical protein